MATHLIRALEICLHKNRASPLITQHLSQIRNTLGDITSRSYGYKAEWNSAYDDDSLDIFNNTFPLPSQNSWTGFRLANGVASKVIQELLMLGWSMVEWRRLPKLRVKYGKNGKPLVDLSACLRTWTTATSRPLQESQQCLGGTSKKGSEEKPLVLE